MAMATSWNSERQSEKHFVPADVCIIRHVEESLCSVSPNTPSTFGAGWSWGFKSQSEQSQVFGNLYCLLHTKTFCYIYAFSVLTVLIQEVWYTLELSWFQDITGTVLNAFGDEAILVACGRSRVPMATCSPWPSTRTLLTTIFINIYHISMFAMLQLSTLLVPEARQTKGDCAPLPGGMDNLEPTHHVIKWKCVYFGLVKIMISQGHHLLSHGAPDHFFLDYG